MAEQEKAEINSAAVHGEPGTGYEGPEDGPFHCANCEYFNKSTDGCRQEDMKKKSKRNRLPSGDVLVAPDGCCAYFEEK
jgi:hypothetical protein